MVTYTILMKPLSVTEPWQDITQAVIEGKDMKIRKGFSSLSSAIDVGNVSLDIHMASLADATLLHVDRKLVQIRMDGVTVFEGVSYDDSSVDLKERSDHVYTKLKFKPYSAFFGDAVAKTDVALIDKKICDPSDTANSLLHILFAMIIENTETPALFSGFNVSTTIVNTKRLPIVLIEADDNLEDHLTKLLYHNGYAYYMDLFTAVVVEPYKDGRSPSTVVKITDVLKSPAINQAPYIDDEKCVVKLGRVDVYDNDTVYELNRDRYEDTGEATEASFIKSGDYYPLDSDDQPSILDASYESERENDNVELIYTEGRSMVYEARQINPNDSSATIPAYIVVAKAELNTLQADIQLYNNLGVDVSLRNIKIMASKAYYRDWSEEYEDKSSKASKVDDYEGIFMPDADTAKAFIRRYVAEKAAERTRINFKTHVVLQPNTLFTITEFPYQLLVRYVTQTEPGFYEYECVAYAITAPNIGSKIKVVSKRGALDGSTVIPVTQYALGDEDGPIEDAIIVADDTYRVADDYMVLGANSSWSTVAPVPGAGEYIWQRIGYYKPPATRPSSWSDPIRVTGIEGESARLLTILASSTIIPVSSRGVPRIAEITLTAELQNIDMPVGGLVWTSSQPGLVLTIVDAHSVKFDTLDVDVESLTIQVEAGAFSASLTIVKLADGKPAPINFGGVDYVPTETPSGEALVVGDYFLWANTTQEINGIVYKKGQVYEYNGNSWAVSSNGDLVMTILNSYAELDDDDETVLPFQVIKTMVAIKAFVKELFAQFIKLHEGGGIYSDYYLPDGAKNPLSTAENGLFLSASGIAQLYRATMVDVLIKGKITINANDSEDADNLEDINAILKTSYGLPGKDLGSLTHQRWRGADACAVVSSGASGTASYNGTNYTFRRVTSSHQLELITIGSAGGGSGSTSGDVTRTIQETGAYRVYVNGSGGIFAEVSSLVYVYRNGTKIVSIASKYTNASYYFTFNKGDTVRIQTTQHNAYLYIYEDGIALTNNSWVNFEFINNNNTAFLKRFIINSWDSSGHINMAAISEWSEQVDVLDAYVPCDIDQSSFVYNGVSYIPTYIMKTTSSLLVLTTSGVNFSFSRVVGATDKSTQGWYWISGSIVTVEELRGVITDTLIPNTEGVGMVGKDIGGANKRYRTVYATKGDFTLLSAKNLPTSDSGLLPGELWRDGTTVKIKV